MTVVKEYIKCIEELNKDLGVVGNKSYIYETTKEIEVAIEGPNRTVSVAIIDKELLISEIENNNWEIFIIDEYLTALRYFDIETELMETINQDYINSYDIVPSQRLYMIENDLEYFKEQLYVKKYIFNKFKEGTVDNTLLFTVKDNDWKSEEGDLISINVKDVIDFANEEVLYTEYSNVRFSNIQDAIIFLRKYNFEIILNDDDNSMSVEKWLERYHRKQKMIKQLREYQE